MTVAATTARTGSNSNNFPMMRAQWMGLLILTVLCLHFMFTPRLPQPVEKCATTVVSSGAVTNDDDDNVDDNSNKQPNEKTAAIVASICAGFDHDNSAPVEQIRRIKSMLNSLNRVNSTLPRVLLASGYNTSQLDPLLHGLEEKGGRGLDRIVYVNMSDLAFKIRTKDDGLMPLSPGLQNRKDGPCTSLKLWAWDLVDYEAIFHTDSDVCFRQNPDPFVAEFVHNDTDVELRAFCETAKRKWQAFNTHLMMFRPSVQIGNILRAKSATGDFVGYTNTEQDVLETFFSPTSWCVGNPNGDGGVKFPLHAHSRVCK